MMVEMEGIPVESLVPEPLRALKGGEEYMARLPEFDKDMEVWGVGWVDKGVPL